MKEIKVGMKLRVIDPEGCAGGKYKKDEIVEVDKVHVESDDDCYYIECVGKDRGMYSHRFEIVEEPNGVDGDGKPIHFGPEDVKMGMKLVTTDGSIYLVQENEGECYATELGAGWGWLNLYIKGADECEYNEYNFVAAYSYTKGYGGANSTLCDRLIWKYVDPTEKLRAERKLLEDAWNAADKDYIEACRVYNEADDALLKFDAANKL